MSLCVQPNCELILVTNTGTTIQSFDFYDCSGVLLNLSLTPDMDYYINYCSTSSYTGSSINVINLGAVENVYGITGCCNSDKIFFGVPTGFTDFQTGDTIHSENFFLSKVGQSKNGCYTIIEEIDYLLFPILDLNLYCSVIESPITYILQDCELCVADNPCDVPKPTPTPSYNIPNPVILPKNECDVITLFPMSAECFSIQPSSESSYDGSVAIGITGGTSPYTIEWQNGNKSSAITNLGYGEYPVKITDFYGDFVIEKVCILGVPPSQTPTPTPTITPTITPTPTPTNFVSTPTPTPTPTATTPKAWFVYSKCGQLYDPPTVIVQSVVGPYQSPTIYFSHNGSCYVFLNIATSIPNFPINYNVIISQTNYFTNVGQQTFTSCDDCFSSVEPNNPICQPFSLFNRSNVQQTYSFWSCETNEVISNIPIQPNQIINICSYSTPVVSNPLVTITVLVGTCP